ncbi:glutathione S-transferase family protein [Methylovirgula sp. 4M-Z18]|uniref:glutathione S-transferase family protein n=1 Tax=Methylovirgula sp. 4M-Z18 TaxID=2293567 RepID=UPI000E2E6D8B|nr:glutathione S-transferase family protein [Methylovirgula sp. 4M-Z18]RFB81065.1 glutathione S-transferase family protein [Methylovirgula sp. 4M-Z18]
MITLHTFGPAFGLPDPSPFVMKADLLLQLSGLAYERKPTKPNKMGPKGKMPYISDNGRLIPDSTFIRFYLEKTYGIDFDKTLSTEQKALAWAVEKMCEEHLYFAIVYDRWMKEQNFANGPAQFFKTIPALVRPPVMAMIRKRVRTALYNQGMGRHSDAEISELACRDIDALATILGDKDWIGGTEPCGADATVGAFVLSTQCKTFDAGAQRAAVAHANLAAYGNRVMTRFYPDFVKA